MGIWGESYIWTKTCSWIKSQEKFLKSWENGESWNYYPAVVMFDIWKRMAEHHKWVRKGTDPSLNSSSGPWIWCKSSYISNIPPKKSCSTTILCVPWAPLPSSFAQHVFFRELLQPTNARNWPQVLAVKSDRQISNLSNCLQWNDTSSAVATHDQAWIREKISLAGGFTYPCMLNFWYSWLYSSSHIFDWLNLHLPV